MTPRTEAILSLGGGILILLLSCVIIFTFGYRQGLERAGARTMIAAPANHACVSICREEDGLSMAVITRLEARPTARATDRVLDGGVR